MNQFKSFWNNNDNDSLVTEDAKWLLVFYFAFPSYFKIKFISYVENNYEIYYQKGFWSKLKRIINSNSDDNNKELVNIEGDLTVGEAIIGEIIKCNNDNNYFTIWGSTEWNKGAQLTLMGKDNLNNSGGFELSVVDSNSSPIYLVGNKTELTWNNNDLAGAAIVSKNLTSNSGYITYATNFMIQYGASNISGEVTNVTYPISFKVAARISGLATAENNGYKPIVRLNSYPRVNYAPIIKDVNGTFSFYYLVIGY